MCAVIDKRELVQNLFSVAGDPWPDNWHRETAMAAAFFISGTTPADDPSWNAIADRAPPNNIEIWMWTDGSCWLTALHPQTIVAELEATHWKVA